MTITRQVVVEATPRDIAEAFCAMDSEQQAEVFQQIGEIASGWKGGSGQLQWAYMCDELLKRGKDSLAWQFAADIGAFTMVHAYRYFENNWYTNATGRLRSADTSGAKP